MNAEDVRFYRDRWKAVEEIEQQELRANTVQTNWKQLNSIMRRAIRLGLSHHDQDNKADEFLIWAKLKDKYEQSKRP